MFYNSPWADGTVRDARQARCLVLAGRGNSGHSQARCLRCGLLISCSEETEIWLLLKQGLIRSCIGFFSVRQGFISALFSLMRSNADFPQSLRRGDLWSPVLCRQYIISHYITPMIILLIILLSKK